MEMGTSRIQRPSRVKKIIAWYLRLSGMEVDANEYQAPKYMIDAIERFDKKKETLANTHP